MATFFCATAHIAFAQKMVIANETTDCGQITYRIPVIAEYEVSNEGNRPLRINEVKTSCGCLKVDFPTEPVEPNGKARIRATFDAAQLGHFTKQLLVYSNADERPTLLVFKGMVVEQVKDFEGTYPFKVGAFHADRNNIEFDDVNRGDYLQAKMHIQNPSSQTVQPVPMHLPNYIKADVSPTKLAPGQSGVIVFTLDSKVLRDFGLTQTTVYLGAHPGEKVSADKEIGISAVLLPAFDKLSEAELQAAPQLTLSSETLELGSFKGKKRKKGDIEIKNTGASELDIRSLQMFTMGLQVSLGKTRLAPGETTVLKIVVEASALKTAKSRPRVLMITNDPAKPKVIIHINVQ